MNHFGQRPSHGRGARLSGLWRPAILLAFHLASALPLNATGQERLKMRADIVVYSSDDLETEIDGGAEYRSLYIKDGGEYIRVFMSREQLQTLGAQIGEALRISAPSEQTVAA